MRPKEEILCDEQPSSGVTHGTTFIDRAPVGGHVCFTFESEGDLKEARKGMILMNV